MPIVASDIKFRLSGGAANTNVNASLGGAKSSVDVVDASLHNLFDIVSSAEALAGDVEYRCVYVHNAHATLTLQNAAVYINTNTPSPDTTVAIGLGSAAVNAQEQSVVDEQTSPTGVTFSTPASGSPLAIGDIAPGAHKAVWIRRNVTAGASAFNSDSVIISITGDTAA